MALEDAQIPDGQTPLAVLGQSVDVLDQHL
jgi:hypothetical protein